MVSSILYAAVLLSASLTANAQDVSAITPKAPINAIPKLGLGTWSIHTYGQENVTNAVVSALKAGYRHIDCATIYGNQKQLGIAIKAGLSQNNLKREDIWVTSKLWADRHGEKANQGLQEALAQLNLDYLDLFLMHFPFGTGDGGPKFDHVATWKAMEKLPTSGKGSTRFIGISNFAPKQVDELLAEAKIRPKVHQFELHPYLQQQDFVDFNLKRNITVTGYAPLGNTNRAYRATMKPGPQGAPPVLNTNPVLVQIAKARGCTSAIQVTLAWNMKRGVAVIPKSVNADHQKENIGSSKCVLTDEDMKAVSGISTQYTARMNNPCRFFNMKCYDGLQLN